MSERPPNSADICVIGAGIVGLATARELQLRHPDAEVIVLEREAGPAQHQTGHSSGVIHAGIYYKPGSLKARLCVRGATRLYGYCAERRIDARRDGKVIVATDEDELPRLEELQRRATANGVPGCERIDPERLHEIEPHAAGIAALHSPSTGVVDFSTVARAYAEDLRTGGAELFYDCEVSDLSESGKGVVIAHSRGTTASRRAVVCAGPWADRIAVAAGADPDPRIVPFRGSYLRLRDGRADLVKASIYPVPDPDLPFLGMHLTRNAAGEVLLGPTALIAAARDAYSPGTVRARDLAQSLAWPGTWRLFRDFWRTGLAEIAHATSVRSFVGECRRYLPELRVSDVERSPHSGVRAQAVGRDGTLIDDFVVSETGATVHVRNAPSPAATASLALAEEICDRLDALG
ncbi:MAG: L-2-hydroxyglutarate oxidase [Solirubrobacterales bacterium]